MPTYVGHGVSLLAIRVVPGTVHEPRVAAGNGKVIVSASYIFQIACAYYPVAV